MADLVVRDLRFRYPGAAEPALDGLDLTVSAGEIILVAGPSGCGKSTLALALCGLVPARVPGRFSGSVQLDGAELRTLQPQHVAQRVGMVFQDPSSQLITPTVENEVAFGPENLGLPREVVAARVREALAMTGCEGLRSAATTALSGGEKQRVAIAATLAMHPEVLVLDEPCSDLDPAGAQDVLAVLHRVNRERGMTVVLIEHRIDEVVPWVDRVLLLDRGRVVLDRPTRAAFRETACWSDLGVGVPEMVRLGLLLPHLFPAGPPLSVAEAHQALAEHPGAELLADPARQIPGPALGDRQAPLLAFEGVGVSYEQRSVLDGVDLTVEEGEWLALAGANGSGKTSLAELAMGFRAPASGRVVLDGRRVDTSDVSRQIHRLAYLFQSADSMLFTATVKDELGFGLKHRRGRRTGPIRDGAGRLESLLKITGLADRREANPFALSAGQRQRLAIAALLVQAPHGLVLDEPTTGQDEGHARAILGFLQELRDRERMTYLMISHDMRVIAAYATRMAVLADGNVAAVGPPAEVFAQTDVLRRAHLVPPPVADLHARLAGSPLRRVALSVEELARRLCPSVPAAAS